jgi:hypothetical protein
MTDDGLFAMDGSDDVRVQFVARGLTILRPDSRTKDIPRGRLSSDAPWPDCAKSMRNRAVPRRGKAP